MRSKYNQIQERCSKSYLIMTIRWGGGGSPQSGIHGWLTSYGHHQLKERLHCRNTTLKLFHINQNLKPTRKFKITADPRGLKSSNQQPADCTINDPTHGRQSTLQSVPACQLPAWCRRSEMSIMMLQVHLNRQKTWTLADGTKLTPAAGCMQTILLTCKKVSQLFLDIMQHLWSSVQKVCTKYLYLWIIVEAVVTWRGAEYIAFAVGHARIRFSIDSPFLKAESYSAAHASRCLQAQAGTVSVCKGNKAW